MTEYDSGREVGFHPPSHGPCDAATISLMFTALVLSLAISVAVPVPLDVDRSGSWAALLGSAIGCGLVV